MGTPYREVRAQYTRDTITVYQAFRPEIAITAIETGKFPSSFKRERMTWIKPSFLWMMYRSGWATKPGQQNVLAIEIRREGFEWALGNSTMSHFEPDCPYSYEQWRESLKAPVRIQWDPERDLHLNKLDHRSLQIGLSGEAVSRYCDDWIVGIQDCTTNAREIARLMQLGESAAAGARLPEERPYTLPKSLRTAICATPPGPGPKS